MRERQSRKVFASAVNSVGYWNRKPLVVVASVLVALGAVPPLIHPAVATIRRAR